MWSARLFVALAGTVISLGLVGLGVSFHLSNESTQIGSHTYTTVVDQMALVADILPPPLYLIEAHELMLELAATPSRSTDALAEIAVARSAYDEREVYWRAKTISRNESAALEAVFAAADKYWGAADRIVSAVAHGSAPSAAQLEGLDSVFHEHKQSVNALVGVATVEARAIEADAGTIATNWNIATTATIAVFTIAAMFFVLAINRQITRRVGELASHLERLSRGDDEHELHGEQLDFREIQQIVLSAEAFRQSVQRVRLLNSRALEEAERVRVRAAAMQLLSDDLMRCVNAVEVGELKVSVRTDFADDDLNRLAAQFNAMTRNIEAVLSETAFVLSRLASADLSLTVNGPYQGVFNVLQTDINAVVERLRAIVRDLSRASGSVRGATSEIMAGTNDLAERSTRQAAAVEETTAALETLTVTVRESAERTTRVAAAVKTMAGDAEQTAAMMQSVEVAMGGIKRASGRIADIVGLIDNIAFQTNLLALNASVEAARAGDAGSGFAVVAVEVRRLAQSAAQASQEVKSTVDSSNAEVANGSALVASASARVVDVLDKIRSSTGLIDAIATASESQSATLIEISSAVQQIDEMTQHNAALVEEVSAAIEQTESQAESLDHIVDIFRSAASVARAAAA